MAVGPDLTFNGGFADAFVANVNESGTALDSCGYIGGTNDESGRGIAIDASGNVYVTGETSSTAASFPVAVGPDLTYNGGYDAFVARVKVLFMPTSNKGYYIKWSQPSVALDPNIPPLFDGWDELSDYDQKPILADDWKCEDDRPVTGVHWWGSYLGWGESSPPSLPEAFHIGIWTNVPDPNVNNPATYSQPDELVWENSCDNYVWDVAGGHQDARTGEPNKLETIFQFTQLLSQDEWFYQQPTGDPNDPQIYWLSIAPVWDGEPEYQWGWHNRPHYFEDDAVRIWNVEDGGGDVWPPTIGVKCTNAEPIPWPGDVSCDLAFELSTNMPGYCDNPIPGDLNCDKIVDMLDLAIMAAHWLETVP